MEEIRPGQHPDAEQRPSEQGVHERAVPGPHEPVASGKERDLIAAAQQRADRDREALLSQGHGDHKGEEGF